MLKCIQMWDTATSAVQAFATVLASPVKQLTSCKQVEAKLLCPPEVCFPLSNLLGPGLLVYDVDNHQICRHQHAATATVGEWIGGMKSCKLTTTVSQI